jgi:hypothetical protein
MEEVEGVASKVLFLGKVFYLLMGQEASQVEILSFLHTILRRFAQHGLTDPPSQATMLTIPSTQFYKMELMWCWSKTKPTIQSRWQILFSAPSVSRGCFVDSFNAAQYNGKLFIKISIYMKSLFVVQFYKRIKSLII